MQCIRMAKIGLWLYISTISDIATASASQAGRVRNAIVNHSGRFFFDHDGQRGAMPTCAVHRRWVVDANTPAGQAMMALVLNAQARGKMVAVSGSSDCQDWYDTEAIDYVVAED